VVDVETMRPVGDLPWLEFEVLRIDALTQVGHPEEYLVCKSRLQQPSKIT